MTHNSIPPCPPQNQDLTVGSKPEYSWYVWFSRLVDRIFNRLQDHHWIEPTLINSWTNVGGSDDTAAFLKDHSGFVWLKGSVAGGTIGAAPIFILPAGYRPNLVQRFAVDGNGAFGRIAVTQTGEVRPVTGSSTNMSLNTIRFKAEL